jgi:hypothetical protein
MITQSEVKKHKEEILRGFQLTTTPTIKSISALFFSGLISTYGIYSILMGMIDGNALTIALGVFILILIIADTFKRGALTKYYNSIIRNSITGTGKILKLNLGIFFLSMAFMIVFDVIGSFSTANYVEQKYKDFRATNSKEYELLEAKAKSGSEATTIYLQLKNSYDQSETKAQTACNNSWRVPKYRTKNAQCMETWHNDHKEPALNEIQTDSTISVSAYQNLKEDANDDFLSQYIFYIILFLSLSLTLLLQYTTISQIQDKKDDIEESLTGMVIGILQDRLSELETNMIQHETQRNELISSADREEKTLGRKFEERGKAISLLALGKAVESRGETVKRIANNESFPHGNQKAGFVMNPMYKESVTVQDEKEKDIHWTKKLKPNGIFTSFDSIYYIWNEGKARKGDELNTLVPSDHKEQFLTFGGGLIKKDNRFYAELDFYDAFVLHLRNGTYHHSGSIDAYEDLTGHKFSKEERAYLISIWNHKSVLQDEKNNIENTRPLTKMDILSRLYANGAIQEGNKLTPKTTTIDIKKRSSVDILSNVYKILIKGSIIELRGNKGYYALKGYSEAIEAIKGAK